MSHTSETATSAPASPAQRALDRLVFLRFLEDKHNGLYDMQSVLGL